MAACDVSPVAAPLSASRRVMDSKPFVMNPSLLGSLERSREFFESWPKPGHSPQSRCPIASLDLKSTQGVHWPFQSVGIHKELRRRSTSLAGISGSILYSCLGSVHR